MPAAWNGPDGVVIFKRRFNWVAALEPNERVVLVFTGYSGTGPVSLNESPLGELAESPTEFDITERLKPGNELLVELTIGGEGETAGLYDYVLLEVRHAEATK